MTIKSLLDLDAYPLDRPDSAEFETLIVECRRALSADGMFTLPGFMRPEIANKAVQDLMPEMQANAFTHQREHNIYFDDDLPSLPKNHLARRKVKTINHTLCADQLAGNPVLDIYEWRPFIGFLARTMEKPVLYPMADPLARVNVMAYYEGEALNWHFDRSEFTTTLLLQKPDQGGEFEYRSELRSDDDPNFEGVANLLAGSDDCVRKLTLEPGALNVFKGKNTAHRVSPVSGSRPRVISVFSYYEVPGRIFTKDERLGFYGRAG